MAAWSATAWTGSGNALTSPERVDEVARIAEAFPNLSWTSVRRITEGWDHVVVILDETTVFRFPLDEDYTALLSLEMEVLDHLAALTSASIPRYALVAPDRSFAGYPIVSGQQLTPDLLASLTAYDRQDVAEQLAAFLTALHAAPLAGTVLGRVPASYLEEDQREVRTAVDKHLSTVLTGHELADVEVILADVDALIGANLPKVFTHNDIYSRHLFWDDGSRRLGVIDFSDMCLGDPAVDFAELYEYGLDFVEEVYARYAGPKDPRFLDRAWTYQRWIGVYMLADHFQVGKTSWAQARGTFDRVRRGRRYVQTVMGPSGEISWRRG